MAIAHPSHDTRRREAAYADVRRSSRLVHFLESRVAFDVRTRPALPHAAESRHAVPDIKKKSLALLLAVVADVDANLDLAGNRSAHRRAARLGDVIGRCRFATVAACVHLDYRAGDRDTIVVGG